jgi:hypothetical protein
MHCVVFADIFYAEVVDGEGELGGTGHVFPKAWCVVGWDVAECSQVFSQFVVGNHAGLREAVHAFADLAVNVPVVNEWEEVYWSMISFGMMSMGRRMYS